MNKILNVVSLLYFSRRKSVDFPLLFPILFSIVLCKISSGFVAKFGSWERDGGRISVNQYQAKIPFQSTKRLDKVNLIFKWDGHGWFRAECWWNEVKEVPLNAISRWRCDLIAHQHEFSVRAILMRFLLKVRKLPF